jgi:hypothetical protein
MQAPRAASKVETLNLKYGDRKKKSPGWKFFQWKFGVQDKGEVSVSQLSNPRRTSSCVQCDITSYLAGRWDFCQE